MRANNVVLPGPSISARHCEIEWNGGYGKRAGVVVRDLSSNGTFVSAANSLVSWRLFLMPLR